MNTYSVSGTILGIEEAKLDKTVRYMLLSPLNSLIFILIMALINLYSALQLPTVCPACLMYLFPLILYVCGIVCAWEIFGYLHQIKTILHILAYSQVGIISMLLTIWSYVSYFQSYLPHFSQQTLIKVNYILSHVHFHTVLPSFTSKHYTPWKPKCYYFLKLFLSSQLAKLLHKSKFHSIAFVSPWCSVI